MRIQGDMAETDKMGNILDDVSVAEQGEFGFDPTLGELADGLDKHRGFGMVDGDEADEHE